MKELREDRRPADLWFWSDWLSSVDVRSCSLAAQGLWINMLAIMSRSDRKGYLSINGKPMTSKELAKFVGVYSDEVERCLVELEYYNVFSRDEDGTIYNRRMKKESELSKKRSEAGRLGGLKKQKSSKHQATCKSKREATLEYEYEYENESIKKEGQKSDPAGESEIDAKFSEFWSAYPREGRLAKKESRVRFGAIVKRGELSEFVKGFHGYMDYLKHQKIKKRFDQTPMYAKTFLGGRWAEFVGFKYEPEL